uniref:Uncharacterized protein n=1 Tax=Pseudo-nitzschia australis TaxID=44445 RepID=A0A6V0BE73_9STRA
MEAKMPTPTPSSSTSLSLCPPPESYFVFVVGHCEEWPEGRDEQGDTAIYTSYLDFGVPADQCKYIKDNDCTRKNCQKQLESFLQKTEKLSESREREHQKQQKGQQHNRTVPNTLVFYYGGHGSANGFATIGGTWAYKQVARTIEECFHGDRVLFLIDCCASGNLWQHLPSASVSTSTTGITVAAASKNVNKKTKEYALLATSQPYITSTADGEEWILTNSWIQLMRRRRTVDNDDEDKDDLSLDEVISLLADRHVFETGDLFFAYVVGKTRLLPLWETNPGTKKQKSGDDSWSWMPSRSRWRAKIREDAANENKKESTSSLSSSSLAWLSSSESLLPSASKDLPQVPKEAAILSVHDCRVGDALAYKHPGGYPTSLRESKHKRTFYVPPLWLHGRIVSVFETDGDEEEASIIGQHNDNDANNHYCDGNATDIIFRIRVWYPSQQKPWEVEVSHRSRRLVNQFFVAQNWMLPKAFCKTQVVMAQKYRQYLDCSVAAHTPIRVQVRVALGSTNGDGSDGHSSNGNKNKNIREGRVLDWKDFHWKELLCYYNDSDSCSATFPGKTKYDEYYWNELPVPIKIAALDLGYTESHWDEDINIPADGMNWQELTEAQKEAATVLGYVRQKPAAGDLSVTLSGKTNYDDYNWNELPAVIQVAALAFGYTESHWDESIDIPADGMDWQELTEAQKEAAAVLGYVREKPAASDSNGSHDGTIYFSQTVCEISTSAGPHVPVVWNDNHQSSLVPLKQIVFAGIKRSPSDILAPKSIQKMTVASSSSLATNDSDGNEELERLRRQSLVEALKSSGKSIGNAESIFGTTKLSAFWPDTEEFYDATPIDIKGKDNNSSGYESSLKLLATHFECPVPGVYCPIVYEDGVRYLVPVNHIYRRGCQPQLQDRGDDESTVSNTDESITTTALSMIPTKDSSDKQINAETSSNQPRSCSTPNKSYVDEYWEDLPEHVQKAAQYVGYKKKLWDLDGNIPIDGQKWKDLNSDQREALEIIGYHEATWNSQNDDTRAQGCIISLARTRPDAFESLDAHGGGKKSLPVPRKVAFHYGDATVTANRAGIFLRKRGICSGDCQPPVDVTSKVTRHHHTYITIGLPRLPLEQPPQEKYLQLVQVLLESFQLLCAVDPAVVLYVFPTKAHKNPAARAVRPSSWSNTTPDRATLETYAHQLWLRGGLRPFLRFFVGHTLHPDTLFSPAVHEQVESRDCQLRVDIIQAAKVVVCGFLVGSYMKTFNIDHYNALLSMGPLLHVQWQ